MSRFARLQGPGRAARWRRTRLRHLLAGCLALAAMAGFWSASRPSAGATIALTVATRALPAGHVLTPGDVRTVNWPAGAVVPGAVPLESSYGQRTLTSLAAGEPVTDARVSRSTWSQLNSGEQAFTIPLANSDLVQLTRAGDRLDLYDPATQKLVVPNARVVISTTPAPSAGAAPGSSDPVLVVAVNRSDASNLAAALASSASLGSGLIAAARPAP